jgi:VIT1/CCC1 family predicted Fe2+/Mn2+ transporter
VIGYEEQSGLGKRGIVRGKLHTAGKVAKRMVKYQPMAKAKEFVSHYLREIVFGLEDSVVSTLGAVSGVAVGSGAQHTVVMTGAIVVAVEALSMAAGSYVSAQAAQAAVKQRVSQDATRILAEKVNDQEAVRDLFRKKKFTKSEESAIITALHRERRLWLKEIMRGEYRLAATVTEVPVVAALVMGVFYLVGGALVLLPYLILPLGQAFFCAIVGGLATLAGVGWVKSVLTSTPTGRSIIEMILVSSTAAAIGILVGHIFS